MHGKLKFSIKKEDQLAIKRIILIIPRAILSRLIERVHMVTAVKTVRMKTCQYKFHIILLCPYVLIFVLMVCLL